MKFRIEHTFPIDRERYENEMFFDLPMNDHIAEVLNLGPKKLLEEQDDEEILYRKNLLSPRFDIPKILKKALGNKGIGYFESTTFYRKEHRAIWSIQSEMFPDKITGHGEFLFEDLGDHTKRIVIGEISVKFFGVGKTIERLIVQNIEDSYEKVSQITQQWIEKHYRHD